MNDQPDSGILEGKADGKLAPYESGYELIRDLLRALDRRLLEAVEVKENQQAQVAEPGLRGLVITEPEVKQYLLSLRERSGDPRLIRRNMPGLWETVKTRVVASRSTGIFLTLDVLKERFNLSVFEIDCVIVCLAAEIDSKYAKIFSYINDDITQKFPTVQMLVELLSGSAADATHLRNYLLPESNLIRTGILSFNERNQSSGSLPLLSFGVRLEEGIARFLLEEGSIHFDLDEVLYRYPYTEEAAHLWADTPQEPDLRQILEAYINTNGRRKTPLVCLLAGPGGAGRHYTAREVCLRVGMGLISVDCSQLLKTDKSRRLLIRAFRNSILYTAPLYLSCIDSLYEDKERGKEILRHLELLLEELGWVVFMSVEKGGHVTSRFRVIPVRELIFELPSYAERTAFWANLLTEYSSLKKHEIKEISENMSAKFRLSAGNIGDAFYKARQQLGVKAAVNEWSDSLHKSASRVSLPNLGKLAQQLKPNYRWDDLVLSEKAMELFRDVVRHVRHRRTVMSDWCFESSLSRGKGLSSLFHGPSGTGKTTAVEVIANELNMEVYRIDLSNVVSKYIGETEKNLASIFAEANQANVILFFDEADALFGKRSEVKDAHDRYANIEINYLLQQMEEYEGIAILATNMRQNLDEAFLRRIQISVEFQMPDEQDRLRIWKKAFPDKAPLADDVDLEFLANSFEISGGNIRNISLIAAFLAADQGCPINMAHLVQATQRELEKSGRRSFKEDFAGYAQLLEHRPLQAVTG